jgi:L-rhamnose isomerase/sugar isomerase
MTLGRLGGFHFNDSKFSDDDLTVGSIKPFQLFLIFNELVYGMENNNTGNPAISWMIDASHNVKDPLEDLLQSVEAIKTAYAKALLVDQKELEEARAANDVVKAEEILKDAFGTDVRPLLAQSRLNSGAALKPIDFFRQMNIRNTLVEERGVKSVATGL